MAKGKGKGAALDELDVRIYASSQTHRTIRHVSSSIVSVVAYLCVAWASIKIAEALAGLQTNAQFLFSVIGGSKTACTLGVSAGIGGTWFGFKERKLRKNVIERDHPRVAELEKQLDSRRTSAKLTVRGDTSPENKP